MTTQQELSFTNVQRGTERIWAKVIATWVRGITDNATLACGPRYHVVWPAVYFTGPAAKRRGVRGRAYSLKWRKP